MKNEVLINVEGVSKKFCRDLKRSLYYGVSDITSEFLGKKKQEVLRKDEFWSVNNVSFELKRGECMGLIGHNGAGKSTLLKILNGLIKPDKGKVTMRGRIAALIELGAGFNPILTGRENIYVNGSVLGFSKKEIDQKFDAIVEFSEISDFIDTPVQNYSSGMKVRLGFAVASQLEPDVLLIDEVLAVGDAGFKIKSYNKIAELMQTSAVVFVSHSMPVISRVCNQLTLMDRGVAQNYGSDISSGIEEYFSLFSGEKSFIEYNEFAKINAITFSHQEDDVIDHDFITYGKDFFINISVSVASQFKNFEVILQFTDRDLKVVGQYYSFVGVGGTIENKPPKQDIKIKLERFNLSDGEYALTIFLSSKDNPSGSPQHLACYRNYKKFTVRGLKQNIYAPIHFLGEVKH
jgi:lipopolysaccharide transport system ATP-binding protein